jgi:predicted AlkP superfamily phosphohydrolase/phosphomutase
MPILGQLAKRGAYTRLRSSARWLVGSPWLTFYTSTPPSVHGSYHTLLWRPEKMSSERPDPSWRPLVPFWRKFEQGGPRAVVLDVPFTYTPVPFNGIEVGGWATHDTLAPTASYPESRLAWIQENFGESPRANERYEQLTADETLAMRDHMIETTARVGNIASRMIAEETWDLFMLCFSTTHRGGHKLWSTTGVKGEITEDEAAAIDGSLEQLYRACDNTIGKVLDSTGENSTVMVFSLHGMGPNTCRNDMLPDMLARVLAGEPPAESTEKKPGLLKRLRQAVPSSWRHEIKQRLPFALQDKLTIFWRMSDIDWSQTRAFCPIADNQGYIRINLKGREAEGIVKPGEEYRELCKLIIRELSDFVDADTHEPVIKEIVLRDEVIPPGQHLDDLPDIIINWVDSPAASHHAISSTRYGEIPWPTPGKNPHGRSGNHRDQGFLIAADPVFKPGQELPDADILDLAPTALDLLGLNPFPDMEGKSLC